MTSANFYAQNLKYIKLWIDKVIFFWGEQLALKKKTTLGISTKTLNVIKFKVIFFLREKTQHSKKKYTIYKHALYYLNKSTIDPNKALIVKDIQAPPEDHRQRKSQ